MDGRRRKPHRDWMLMMSNRACPFQWIDSWLMFASEGGSFQVDEFYQIPRLEADWPDRLTHPVISHGDVKD